MDDMKKRLSLRCHVYLEKLPENLTYPSVTPVLMAEALKCEKE